MPTIPLPGCTPEPLMNYLKALGILRLVAEQVDPRARGCWRDGVFELESTIDEADLSSFFTNKYEPTPILSPWNGDGGFLTESGASYATIQRLQKTTSERLARIREAISIAQDISALREFGAAREDVKALEKKKKARRLNEEEAESLKVAKATVKSLKEGIIFTIRSEFPDQSLSWLDACMLVETDGFQPSPLLGSGGVDGRMEFSANFLGNVLTVIEDPASAVSLRASLFATSDARLTDTSVGQFAPGRIGGPNATQGMEGSSMINLWDYVLMIEGSLLFAGALSRKLSVSSRGRAAFPFTVRASESGLETLSATDTSAARGEIWLPLWCRPTGLNELRSLFSEGRAELEGRQSRDAVEFARAVAGLGVDRGIRSFTRQGFLKRNGKAFLATSLGRFDVDRREHVDLLREIDPWLRSYRSAIDKNSPARFSSALRRIERAIFDFCRYGGATFLQRVLIALGNAESVIASAPDFREKKPFLRPLAGLSSEWVAACSDGSAEFAMALALASVRDPTDGIPPLRANLESVTILANRISWAEQARSVVWSQANLPTNLAAVLTRRLVDATKAGGDSQPLAASHGVYLFAITRFLAGELDEEKMSELLHGLVLCDLRRLKPAEQRPAQDVAPLPRIYALLKLLFLSTPVSTTDVEIVVEPDPSVLALLRAQRLGEAVEVCLRRLRAKRLIPLGQRVDPRESREDDHGWGAIDGTRLAAALLFPVTAQVTSGLLQLVLRPTESTTS